MATNYASATYTEIIDLQTIPDSVSIIGIHTPQGTAPYERLKGFFTQFRKYRYDGASLTMIPAANLPVDPLGLTGVVGTTDLMDPRDALNPVLAHGCHGETLEGSLNMIYTKDYITKADANKAELALVDENVPAAISGNSEVADSAIKFDVDISKDLDLYYEKLTDRSWKKFGIQSPIRLNNLHPLVHRVVQNMPTLPHYDGLSDSEQNAGVMTVLDNNRRNVFNSTVYGSEYAGVPAGEIDTVGGWIGDISVSSNTYKQQFTNRMERLGWLPTSMPDGGYNALTMLPKCFMQVLVMPPAYNVTQFFRCAIKHRFSFSGFTSSLNLMAPPSLVKVPAEKDPPYHNWIDYGSSIDAMGAKSEVISDGVA